MCFLHVITYQLQFSGPRKNSFLICPSHTFSPALEMRPPGADLPWRVFVNFIRYLGPDILFSFIYVLTYFFNLYFLDEII
ncbi:hypothetical protein ACJIZ3_025885 [Penstemon smallii]|uniref:Uncharacterized protein n=1 Tax=Penstemon smallii TaxID=265156 RepID=A0ABD3TVW5_9LAMI